MSKNIYTKDCLVDTWEVTGSKDKDALYDLLKELSEATEVIRLKSDSIQLFTVRDLSSSTLNGYLHNVKGTVNMCIPLDELASKHGANQALLKETVKESYFLIKLGDEYFYATKHALKTLSQRAGSAMGLFALRDEVKIRFHRDAGYVAYMGTDLSDCCVMYRKVNNAKKVYAVFTDRYKLLAQYPLIKQMIEGFEKEMGESDLVYYRVNNFMTEVYLEFPEKAKDFQQVYALPNEVVPGILIHLSDAGDSSFIIDGTTRIGHTIVYVPGSEYTRAHTTNAEMDEIFKFVGESVFAAYTKMPERFVELLQIQIQNPVSCVQAVGKYLELRKVIGAKLEKNLIESLTEAVNPSVPYTAYDIANMFIEAGADLEWIEGDDDNGSTRKRRNTDAISKLRNCLTKAIFFKYEKLA